MGGTVMKITIDERLQKYMQRKQLRYIVLRRNICRTWVGMHVSVAASFADEQLAAQLLRRDYQQITTNTDIIVLADEQMLQVNREITLSLSSFLWYKKIIVAGFDIY